MIGITRNRLRNLSIWGCFGLALLAAGSMALPMPAWANYQAGVDAYYRGDFQGAHDAWLPLAQAGDPVAQNSLGALYDHGLGVQEDNWEAARWYEMAAQQGLPLAMRNLANQYAAGHGIPYDLDLARQWYQRAADLGDQQSVALLRQLRPSTAATATAATPEFAAPATTGTLAAPVESPATAASQDTIASPDSSDDLVVTGMDSVDSSAPAMPAGGIALDIGGQTVTLPASGEPAAPAAQQQPAQQQAAIIAPPARSDGNWLVGQWQGPSLGCPKDGGIEFTDGETLSWFDGSVAVRMAATYRIEGDNIAVVSTASDGSTQEYAYRRSSADQMVIVGVPESMPKSMIGITYRRCGASGALAATQPGIIEVPTTSTQASQPSTTAAAAPPPDPAATTAALADVQVPAGVTAADGWQAFENGNPVEALAIFRTLGEAGDSNMQVIVGQIYDFGQGVPQDDPQALQWYLRAAEAGNPKGQYQAGALYYRSQGVPQNLIEAYRWLAVAAEGKPQGLEVNPAQSVAIQAKSMLNDVARLMSDGDISKAKKLAAETLKKN